jgi:hypothetical protein
MVRGWSTEERRSSVSEGTSEMRELRCSEVCLGSRRRRRSLLVVRRCHLDVNEVRLTAHCQIGQLRTFWASLWSNLRLGLGTELTWRG